MGLTSVEPTPAPAKGGGLGPQERAQKMDRAQKNEAEYDMFEHNELLEHDTFFAAQVYFC